MHTNKSWCDFGIDFKHAVEFSRFGCVPHINPTGPPLGATRPTLPIHQQTVKPTSPPATPNQNTHQTGESPSQKHLPPLLSHPAATRPTLPSTSPRVKPRTSCCTFRRRQNETPSGFELNAHSVSSDSVLVSPGPSGPLGLSVAPSGLDEHYAPGGDFANRRPALARVSGNDLVNPMSAGLLSGCHGSARRRSSFPGAAPHGRRRGSPPRPGEPRRR